METLTKSQLFHFQHQQGTLVMTASHVPLGSFKSYIEDLMLPYSVALSRKGLLVTIVDQVRPVNESNSSMVELTCLDFRLYQCNFHHLISNAIKFSPQNS